ncbi:MAG: dihydroorotase [Halobacteriaceae archaeon]
MDAYVIQDAVLADGRHRDVRVGDDGTIDAVGRDLSAPATVDAGGRHLLPGMIDVHVHFRQPGFPHKETWATGTRSAAAGGVTTVVDQPNTDPPTVDGQTFDQKAALAAEALVDFGINGGVTGDWRPDALFDRPLFALGEVFLADSTGDMGIPVEQFRRAAERAARADVTVTVHAEDADRFDESARGRQDADAWSAYRTPAAEHAAVEEAVAVAEEVGADLHVAHTSTPGGVDRAADGGATCEVTPHHVFLSREDYGDLGTFGRMNPPLRSEQRRQGLFDRLVDGTVDVVATDHAPHALAEKETDIWSAPSGVPGVETARPLLLAAAARGDLPLERVAALTAGNPAAIFDLSQKGRIEAGRDADLTLVDLERTTDIRGDDLHSKCGWTPFEGMTGVFPLWTAVRGRTAYRDSSAALDLPAALAPADGPFGDVDGVNVREPGS